VWPKKLDESELLDMSPSIRIDNVWTVLVQLCPKPTEPAGIPATSNWKLKYVCGAMWRPALSVKGWEASAQFNAVYRTIAGP
jgi:hypothetical protein